MSLQSGVVITGIEGVLAGFAALPFGVQRKYLRASVNRATKPYVPQVKALVNRGPTGNLRRSVGVITEAKVRGRTQTAVLGFRRGDAAGTNGTRSGYHAWWIENGVRGRPGTGRFGAWADTTLPAIREALIQELGQALPRAIDEAARRAMRAR